MPSKLRRWGKMSFWFCYITEVIYEKVLYFLKPIFKFIFLKNRYRIVKLYIQIDFEIDTEYISGWLEYVNWELQLILPYGFWLCFRNYPQWHCFSMIKREKMGISNFKWSYFLKYLAGSCLASYLKVNHSENSKYHYEFAYKSLNIFTLYKQSSLV